VIVDFESYGGRRFLLSAGCGWVATSLLVGGFIDQLIFRDLILYTVAAYIAGNTAQKVMAK
jgi:hypothetical protein